MSREPSRIMPSAPILSPVVRINKSDFTMSSIGISNSSLSLLTRHFILDDSSCSLSKAYDDPYSLKVDISDAIIIDITIPTVSYQSKSLIKKIVFIPRAIKRIRIIGSPKLSKNSIKKESFFMLVI